MAVTFKTDQSYGLGLLPLFGVGQKHIEMCKEYEILIDQSSPGTFTIQCQGMVYGTVPVKGQAISLAKSGNLGPASKQAIQFQFEQAIQKAASACVPVKKAISDDYQFVTNEMDEDDMPSLVAPKIPVSKPVAFSSNTPSQLEKASELYEPCLGTSHGSVYYVIAMLTGMNLACRMKSDNLSLRAEGSMLKDYKAALTDLGFTFKDHYASVHFAVNNIALAQKTIGAVVGRVGFMNVVQVGDIGKMGHKA